MSLDVLSRARESSSSTKMVEVPACAFVSRHERSRENDLVGNDRYLARPPSRAGHSLGSPRKRPPEVTPNGPRIAPYAVSPSPPTKLRAPGRSISLSEPLATLCDGTLAAIKLQHEEPERRGKIAVLTLCVDTVNKGRQGHKSPAGNFRTAAIGSRGGLDHPRALFLFAWRCGFAVSAHSPVPLCRFQFELTEISARGLPVGLIPALPSVDLEVAGRCFRFFPSLRTVDGTGPGL